MSRWPAAATLTSPFKTFPGSSSFSASKPENQKSETLHFGVADARSHHVGCVKRTRADAPFLRQRRCVCASTLDAPYELAEICGTAFLGRRGSVPQEG